MKLRITALAHHRNGVSGESFHVATFRSSGDRMVAIVFDAPKHVAVLDLAKLGQGDIAFGSNSFRADDFEDALRWAIREYEERRRLRRVSR